MGYEWAHNGSVRLRPGSTLQDVLNLYPCADGEPHLPLTESGEAELENGHVQIRVENDLLDYDTYGDRASLDDEVTAFLQAIADELAAEGWIDCGLEGCEEVYGPTDLARAKARLDSARLALESAERELAVAEADVRRLEAPQA